MSYGAPAPFRGRFADLDAAPVSVPFEDYQAARRWKNGEAPDVATQAFVSDLYDEEINDLTARLTPMISEIKYFGIKPGIQSSTREKSEF